MVQPAFIGFGFFWILSAVKALYAIKKKKFLDHKMWNHRSYVMAASSGLIRPYLILVDCFFSEISADKLFSMGVWLAFATGLILWSVVGELSQKDLKKKIGSVHAA